MLFKPMRNRIHYSPDIMLSSLHSRHAELSRGDASITTVQVLVSSALTIAAFAFLVRMHFLYFFFKISISFSVQVECFRFRFTFEVYVYGLGLGFYII